MIFLIRKPQPLLRQLRLHAYIKQKTVCKPVGYMDSSISSNRSSHDYQDIPSSSSNIDVGKDENEKEPDKVSRDQKSSPLVPFQQSPTTCENKRRDVPPRSCKNKKTEEDPGGKRLEKFITNVENKKKNEAFAVDKSEQIVVGESGLYEEEMNYEKTRILGTGQIAGTVFAVLDIKTGNEVARKTVDLAKFKAEEVRALYDLKDNGYTPFPFIFQRIEGDFEIFMESIDGAVTFAKMRGNGFIRDNTVRRMFSLFMFFILLTAVWTLNQHGWTHGELHPRNILVDLLMNVKFVDLATAKKLKDDDGHVNFRKDIQSILKKYILLYLNTPGGDLHEKEHRRQKLDKVAKKLNISNEDKEECLTLIDKCMDIREPNQLKPFLEEVKEKYESIPERDNLMEQVRTFLFADEYKNVHPPTPDEGQSSMDYTASRTEGCTVSQPEMDDGLQDAYKNLRITEKIDF